MKTRNRYYLMYWHSYFHGIDKRKNHIYVTDKKRAKIMFDNECDAVINAFIKRYGDKLPLSDLRRCSVVT